MSSRINRIPERGRVLFYTAPDGPNITLPKSQKSQAGGDQDDDYVKEEDVGNEEDNANEEERRNAISEDNMIDLNADEAGDDERDYDYNSDDTDVESRSQGPTRKEPERKEDNDTPLEPLEQTQHYVLSDLGEMLPFRGQGPELGDDTGAMDCTLVAGQLLLIGLEPNTKSFETDPSYPYGPRGPGFYDSLSEFHQLFHQTMTQVNMARNSAEANAAIRDKVFSSLLEATKGFRGLKTVTFPDVWGYCTSFSTQFQFRVETRRTCVHCGETVYIPIKPGSFRDQSMVVLEPNSDDSQRRITMEESLQRYFDPKTPEGTHVCGGTLDPVPDAIQESLVISGSLPAVLAVVPPVGSPDIEGATADEIRINYESENRWCQMRPCTATYRWIGGVYQRDGRYRVYWRDDATPDDDTLDYGTVDLSWQLKIYDPMQANGIIIGGVSPEDHENKIVDYWAKGCQMLFYNRASIKTNSTESR
ncbi:hypothetical protein MMC11_006084 [Xylographa trunciseda]|nr:hypothetical protein [Xylographa trunciseda]